MQRFHMQCLKLSRNAAHKTCAVETFIARLKLRVKGEEPVCDIYDICPKWVVTCFRDKSPLIGGKPVFSGRPDRKIKSENDSHNLSCSCSRNPATELIPWFTLSIRCFHNKILMLTYVTDLSTLYFNLGEIISCQWWIKRRRNLRWVALTYYLV